MPRAPAPWLWCGVRDGAAQRAEPRGGLGTAGRKRGVGPPVAGSVVLVRFPFSDLSRSKRRPAGVLASAGRGDWVPYQVTSKPYGDQAAIEVEDSTFAEGGSTGRVTRDPGNASRPTRASSRRHPVDLRQRRPRTSSMPLYRCSAGTTGLRHQPRHLATNAGLSTKDERRATKDYPPRTVRPSYRPPVRPPTAHRLTVPPSDRPTVLPSARPTARPTAAGRATAVGVPRRPSERTSGHA